MRLEPPAADELHTLLQRRLSKLEAMARAHLTAGDGANYAGAVGELFGLLQLGRALELEPLSSPLWKELTEHGSTHPLDWYAW
jgi:hypothetical protein